MTKDVLITISGIQTIDGEVENRRKQQNIR